MNSFSSYSWWGPPTVISLGLVAVTIVAVLAIAIVALKGYALWHAAKRDEMWWFIALLVLNTVGILELIYIIFIAKKWNVGAKSATMGTNDVPTSKPDDHGSQAN